MNAKLFFIVVLFSAMKSCHSRMTEKVEQNKYFENYQSSPYT